MMREGKFVSSVLTGYGAISKNEDVYMKVEFTHTETGDHQNFLDSYADEMEMENIIQLFKTPVQWKNTTIVCNRKFDVNFDVIKFDAVLTEIKVTRKETKDDTIFTYKLVFEKEQDKDVDVLLTQYFKHKEETAEGKKVLVEFDTEFKKW